MMLRIRFKIWCMSHKRARKAKKAEKVEIERAKRMLKPIFETIDALLIKAVNDGMTRFDYALPDILPLTSHVVRLIECRYRKGSMYCSVWESSGEVNIRW